MVPSLVRSAVPPTSKDQTMKKRVTRKSIAAPPQDAPNPVGSFSTRFSLPSFVKRVEKLTDDQRNAIKKTGFGNLLLIPNLMLSKNLLVELMDKWSCEKCAFLLPPGKVKITLMDVVLILGLPVTGNLVVVKEDEPFSDLEMEFGAVLCKRKIAMSTIESKLDSLGEVANDEFVRAFLLFTMGTLLFPNASANVESRYLSFLKYVDNVGQFAWGSAVLVEMVAWLNKRKEKNVQYIGGCLIFLQIWSYEHIDIARPALLDTHLFPRACRWENSRSTQRQWVTTQFKDLQYHQIVWKLEPTSAESECSIVKELLERENVRIDILGSESSSVDELIDVDAIENDSDTDIVNEVEEEQNVSLDELRSSVSYGELEVGNKHAKLPLELQDTSTNHRGSNVDELQSSDELLKEQNIELKQENDKLRSENMLLRDQIVKLEKKVEDLKRENQNLSSSTDNLVFRLENILLNDYVNSEGVQQDNCHV